MGGFFREATHPVGRKAYRCEACWTSIPVGERHYQQTGVYDGRWFANRFHDECFDVLCEEAADMGPEFSPGSYDPPARLACRSGPPETSEPNDPKHSTSIEGGANGVQLGQTSWFVKASDAMEAARSALAGIPK